MAANSAALPDRERNETRMKAAHASLWILTAAVAFALGRLGASQSEERGLATVVSFESALASRDELERAHRMGAFLRAMGPSDLPAALRALEAKNIGVSREEVRLFMLAWSRFDAPAAFAWARAWPTPWSDTLTEQAIYAWGFRDAPAALRELETVEDPERQARLRHSLIEGWLHGHDRSGAGEYVAALSNPRQRGRLTFVLAAETMRDGPEAVMRWAEAVPETAPNDWKQGAFYQASNLVARQDPRRAAAWFETHRTRPYSAGSLEGIAVQWSEYHDPPALFDWLRGLPVEGERPDERATAIASGFSRWVQKAPGDAEAWLEAELPDPLLDPAIAELVRALTPASPASALAWSARIEGEALRRNTALRAGRSWRAREPTAVEEWLAQHDLPEGLEQAILAGGPPTPGGRLRVRPPSGPAGRP
jgi:hypothetical protein